VHPELQPTGPWWKKKNPVVQKLQFQVACFQFNPLEMKCLYRHVIINHQKDGIPIDALQLLTFPVNVLSLLGHSMVQLNQEFVHIQRLSLRAHINAMQTCRGVLLHATQSAPHYTVASGSPLCFDFSRYGGGFIVYGIMFSLTHTLSLAQTSHICPWK
jgi:hypothetical protein